MPRVYNKKFHYPLDAVYIGRPSLWGNPYSHLDGTLAEFQVNSREEAIEAYRQLLAAHPAVRERAKRELRGKNLVCWCSPKPCHGDVLLEIANAD